MRKGVVGNIWKAERNTVKVKPHIVKKRRVKSGAVSAGHGAPDYTRREGSPGD
jgi:hypothetical protein